MEDQHGREKESRTRPTILCRITVSYVLLLSLSYLTCVLSSACISAGVRLYGAIMIFSSNKSRLFYWIDFAALCTYPEIASGFLILCLPVFPNFIKYLRTRLGFKSTGDEEGSWPGSPLDVPSSRMTRSWGHIAQSGLDYEGSNEDIVYLTADRTRSDGGYSELLRTKRGSEGADSLEPLEPDRPKRTLMRNFDL